MENYNALTAGSCIKGEIYAEGDYHMDGKLIGNIQCKGKLVIGQTGLLQGNARCEDADIAGEVRGDLTLKNNLTLRSKAMVVGQILTDTLCVEPGAKFNGSVRMGKFDEEPAEEPAAPVVAPTPAPAPVAANDDLDTEEIEELD